MPRVSRDKASMENPKVLPPRNLNGENRRKRQDAQCGSTFSNPRALVMPSPVMRRFAQIVSCEPLIGSATTERRQEK